jgi:hypothetical protein
MYLLYVTGALPPVGFPIRKSPGQSLFSGSPKLIAAYHVLHRLSLPRHPPYALSSLTIKKLNLIKTAVHTPETARAISCFFTYRSFDMQLSKNSIQEALSCRQKLVEVNGIEPMTPCVQGRCSPS